ncbi:MAG: SLATT domain-containing protein [Azoarcus sp.]|nr:SLATT domain-containing protein [Azoarcus sp.]
MNKQYEVHSPATRRSVATELERLEGHCVHCSEVQFNASRRWAIYHYGIGVTTILFAVLASVAYFGDLPKLAGALTTLVAMLAALITFMKSSERACAHKIAADQYMALYNESRIFREIRLFHACDDQAAIAGLEAFTKRQNELDQASPTALQRDEDKANGAAPTESAPSSPPEPPVAKTARIAALWQKAQALLRK